MIAVVVIAAIFLITGGRVVRWQAVALLLIYLVSMPFTISEVDECEDDPTAQDCADVAAGVAFSPHD